MFESVTPSNQPAPEAPRAPAPPSTPLEIHTMPERFLGGGAQGKGLPMGAPKPKGSGRGLIIAISIIVVVGLGVVAALFFTDIFNKNAANTNNTNLVTNTANVNANANANTNVNGNANGNANANSNANTNANGNVNVNTNGNVNGNVNTSANQNVNSDPQAKSSVDTDKDELTDAEESIFGTNPSSSDSDGDSFLDGKELKLGYYPLGAGKLAGTSLVSTFTNALYGSSVLYPRQWVTVARSSTEQIFTNPTGDENITLAVYDNPARLTAKQWYMQQTGSVVDATGLVDVASWDTLSTGVISPNGLVYYFANAGQLYVISLNYGLKRTVDSRATFEMLARSLTVDPTKVNVNTNTTNANANTNTTVNTNTNANTNSNTNSST